MITARRILIRPTFRWCYLLFLLIQEINGRSNEAANSTVTQVSQYQKVEGDQPKANGRQGQGSR